MKNILTIIKKEFARFFGDRRLVLTTLVLPGLLIFVMYSLIGSGLTDRFTHNEDYTPKIYVENRPDSLSAAFGALKAEWLSPSDKADEAIFEEIRSGAAEAYIVFPDDFDTAVGAYNPLDGATTAPQVKIYYNSVKTESASAYSVLYGVLNAYENAIANKFDVNAAPDGGYDLASERDTTGQIFSMLLPMLMMMFMFSGCMAVAPESIAGEKERGTIATLLVTPIKRSELAIGKIVSLSVIALLSGVSSFIGTAISLPKLMGGALGNSVNVYGYSDYLGVLLIILSTVLILNSLVSIISCYAKSVKEATTLVMPLMLLVMLLGFSSMFSSGGAPTALGVYFIPLYNSVQAMNGIFSFTASATAIAVTALSNIAYMMILVFVLAKMFGSEKIMFSK